MPVIEATELVREYGPRRGVCGVSFAVEEGECVACLGRNGSGKSTLARLLLGREEPDAGELRIFGQPVGKGARHHLGRLGVALDTAVHWEALSGRVNAEFVAQAYGLGAEVARRRTGELLDAADLADMADEPVATWSYGMRRKLSLIEALVHRPPLLVLDEATAGVDAHFLVAFSEMVRSRSAAGRATWVASNDPDWVAGVATRVLFLDAGRVVAEGTVEELVAEVAPFQEARVELAAVSAVPRPELCGLRSFEQDGGRITAVLERDPAMVAQLIDAIVSHGGEMRNIEVSRAGLRDAFLVTTGRTLDG